MIYFLALLPATALTIAGYFVLYLAARSEGALRTFGRYLGFWAFTLAGLLIAIGTSKSAVNTTVHVGGLLSPYTIIDGVRIWLGGNHEGLLPAAHIGGFGPLYGALALLLLAASLGGLAVRYRKVSQS